MLPAQIPLPPTPSAITRVAWQPGDGRLLAFIGASNGPTADLYLYDTQTREITQLTDGPSQAVLPVWSPDGQYILHLGAKLGAALRWSDYWRQPVRWSLGGARPRTVKWSAYLRMRALTPICLAGRMRCTILPTTMENARRRTCAV